MPGAEWKFAVLVGRNVGNAHLRNKHKRWVREAFRRNRRHLSVSGDLIVRVNRAADNYQQVEHGILEAYNLANYNSHLPG